MNSPRIHPFLWAGLLAVGLYPAPALAQSSVGAAARSPAASQRDGQRDFDFHLGSWKTRLSRLQSPLSGSTTWLTYEGTTVVSKVWDGRANLVELDVTGPSGRLVALSLRLYHPEGRQWSLNFANRAVGTFSPPSVGEFKDGKGEFYSQESYKGRVILVRFVISPVTADSIHFEQSYSDDGGKSWETNWIADDTRTKDASAKP